MIVIPETTIKIWCEKCKGKGEYLNDAKWAECEECSCEGYIEHKISDLILKRTFG